MRSVPKPGQKVAVRHRQVAGIAKAGLERSKDIDVRTITGVYMGSHTVRDHVGETWEVTPNDEDKQNLAEWKTVR